MTELRNQILNKVLTFWASIMIKGYETAEELEEAIAKGTYDPHVLRGGFGGIAATFRLEHGEGKVMFCEDSTWAVWFGDIMSRWYNENKEFIDDAINGMFHDALEEEPECQNE